MHPTRRGAFGAMRHRDFRILWAGALVSFTGGWIQIVATGLYVYSITGSKEALGLIGLVGGLPSTALMLLGGVIADRTNKRALVLVTQCLYAVSSLAMAWLIRAGAASVWHLTAFAAWNGLVFGIDGPARQAIIREIVGLQDLPSAIGLQSGAFNLARITGPAIGGIVYASAGPAWCFAANALTFSAMLLALLLVRSDIGRAGDSSGSVFEGLKDSFRELASNQRMRGVVQLTGAASLLAVSFYTTLMPAMAADQLGITGEGRRYGWLFSAIGFGALAGAFLVGALAARDRRGNLMSAASLVFASSLIALATVRNYWLALPICAIVGMASIAQLATANTLTQSLAPDNLQGRAVSLHMFAMAGLHPLGAGLAGSLAERFGVSAALGTGGLLFATVAGMILIRNPSVAKLP